jgi:tRNA threonylcarbamoyladenosine biosynthesis protein TsaB
MTNDEGRTTNIGHWSFVIRRSSPLTKDMGMILAIDTATRWTGLALHDGDAILAEMGWQSARNQTVELAPALDGLLRRYQLDAAELTAVAIAIGPGSYTGLRVGLGLAKGLALANGTPLIGAPTLDIVAASLTNNVQLLVKQIYPTLIIIAEAGRSRVCAGAYQWERGRSGGQWQPQGAPTIESWPDLLAQTDPGALFAGEIGPAAARLIRQAAKQFRTLPPAVNPRRAGYLAEIGWERFRRQQLDDAAQLTPIYLREA